VNRVVSVPESPVGAGVSAVCGVAPPSRSRGDGD
jgi:hypothetical protein